MFRQLFEDVLKQCIDKGMVAGRRQAIDSVAVKANASMSSLIEKGILDDASAYLGESTSNLNDLITVITADKLRMSDDERFKMIDHIFSNIEDQYSFLRDFANNTTVLNIERQKEKQEVDVSKKLYGIK